MSAITIMSLYIISCCLFTCPSFVCHIGTVVAIIMLLFGGFYIKNLPYIVDYLAVLSPFQFAYNGALIVLFNSVDVKCNDDIYTSVCSIYYNLPHTNQNIVPLSMIYSYLNISGTLQSNILVLLVYCILSRVIAYLALRFRKIVPTNK